VSFTISAAARAQLPEIRDIYNEVIRNSTAVFSDVEVTLENREAWFEAKCAAGFPVLAAADASGVLGFGTSRGVPHLARLPLQRRAQPARARGRRGRGVGRALVLALLEEAARMQKHVMIAGIDAQNVTSIALHEKLGFQPSGELKEVAFKFGRWLDLKFMQRLI
jgi:L-amino acid N-acyltransferase YncA